MIGLELVSGIAIGAATGYWFARKTSLPGGDQEEKRQSSCVGDPAPPSNLTSFVRAMEGFQQWLAKESRAAGTSEFWASLAELVRTMLHECCDATHVKVYRMSAGGKELTSIREASPLVQTDVISARRGIVGHVATTGRSFLASDPAHGALLDELAQDRDSGSAIAWCFAVQRGSQRLGVVTVGQLGPASRRQASRLRLAERLVEQFWLMAACAEKTKALEELDPVCGLLSRPSFLEMAGRALREAYDDGAPAAVAVLALEGLRGMNDCGRWEVADELLREISTLLKAKVRSEDVLGRFDGSRFIVLLRRVDSELATLIVRQLMAQLATLCGDVARWGAGTQMRCGLTGSGTGRPDLRTLVSQALVQSQRAREQKRLIAADVLEAAEVQV